MGADGANVSAMPSYRRGGAKSDEHLYDYEEAQQWERPPGLQQTLLVMTMKGMSTGQPQRVETASVNQIDRSNVMPLRSSAAVAH